MRERHVVTAGTFRLSSSRLSWPKLAKARTVWCRRSISESRNYSYFVWVIQQSKVVGCCPVVQTLTVRRCFVKTPVDMLAVEVTSKQTGVWERRDGRWCESRAWNFVDVNDLILQPLRKTTQSLNVLETDRPVTIPTARGQTWQGRDSCSGLTQRVRSWESLACLQLCSGSPIGR